MIEGQPIRGRSEPPTASSLRRASEPLHVGGRRQSFGNLRAPLAAARHDGLALGLQLVHEVVHLLPFGAELQSFTGSAGSAEETQSQNRRHLWNAGVCVRVAHLTTAAVTLGFSGSTMVSVMMEPEETPIMPALPKPPNAGTFFPERSASLRACCSSLAFLLISAFASRS